MLQILSTSKTTADITLSQGHGYSRTSLIGSRFVRFLATSVRDWEHKNYQIPVHTFPENTIFCHQRPSTLPNCNVWYVLWPLDPCKQEKARLIKVATCCSSFPAILARPSYENAGVHSVPANQILSIVTGRIHSYSCQAYWDKHFHRPVSQNVGHTVLLEESGMLLICNNPNTAPFPVADDVKWA